MPLLLATHFSLAHTSLRRRRTRSFLTSLGIAIGVASIVLILSLTGSITRLISAETIKSTENLIVVRPTTTEDTINGIIKELTATNNFNKSPLTLNDVTNIEKLENIKTVAPLATTIHTLQSDRDGETHTVESASVLATTPSLESVLNLPLRSGTFIQNTENTNTPTAVIGKTLSLHLLGTSEPIGTTVSFLGQKFIITGILSKEDQPINYSNIDFDNTLIVPIAALAKLEPPQIQQIDVVTTTKESLPTATAQIADLLTKTKSGDTNFTVAYGDKITHPASTFLNLISGILTLVAGISLIVGGIGIMNIMLVSVAERTHEIGLRKALGATNFNIFSQFLIESLILSFAGSILGLVLGYALAFLVSIITPFTPYLSLSILLVPLCVTVLESILFGLYPALHAAHQTPVEAMRRH